MHEVRAVFAPEETVSWLYGRRKDVTLLREADRHPSHQVSFMTVGDAIMKTTLTPKGLQNTMGFAQTSLPNAKLIWLNATVRKLNLDRVRGKSFQTSLPDGRIHVINYESQGKRLHYGGSSFRQFKSQRLVPYILSL